MNLAQFIDPEYVERMRARGDVRPRSAIARMSDPPPREAQGVSRKDAIRAALRAGCKAFDEIFHVTGGGNRNSFGVTLAQMRAAGEVLAHGEPGSYRYSLREETPA